MALHLLIFFAFMNSIHGHESNYFSNGSANPLAVGGSYISRGECPWLCPIFYTQTSLSAKKYLCSSSLITNKFVLTAAHCVQPKGYRNTQFLPHEYLIYAGKFDLSNDNEPKAKLIRGADIKIHQDWDFQSGRYHGDIALIEMQEIVQFSQNFLDRIALPSRKIQANPGIKGFVVGYGRSEVQSTHENVPRRIEIPIVDTETCYQSHFQIGAIKSRNSFCAGSEGKIPCNGDSGGSFYVNDKKTPVILGVVSVGITGTTEKPCNDEVYALFADVSKYVEWIKNEVGGSGFLTVDRNTDYDDDDDDDNLNTAWKDGSGFCEYFDDAGYRCDLRGIHSTEPNFRVTQFNGNHLSDNKDGDVTKFWIKEQRTTYIPELSKALIKFPRLRELRIWSCQLKFIEKSKLKVFKNIKILDFFNNLIEEIPEDAFNDLVQLEELILIKNRIKSLPSKLLKNLRNLKWLRAQENEIEFLPATLFDGTQIVEIQMSKNNLKKIFVDFKLLKNVNVIDFNSNDCINKCLGHYCERIKVEDMQREIELKCR